MKLIDFGTVGLLRIIAVLLCSLSASSVTGLAYSIELKEVRPNITRSQDGVLFLIKGKAGDQFVEIHTGGYRFKAPKDWKAGTESEKESFRPKLQADPRMPVTVLAMFVNRRESCLVVVYETHIDDGLPDNYLDTLQEQNIEKFRMGTAQGIVKQVFENRRATLDVNGALLLDWEGVRGGMRRTRQWVLHLPTRSKDVVTVSGFCNDEGHASTKDTIDKIAASVRDTEDKS